MPKQSIYERDEWNDKLELIEGWARAGLTNEQIAKNMGISENTLYIYKDKYVEFDEALKKGKEVVDFEVENALYKNAIGYHYNEEQVTNDGRVVEVEKYSKPQTTAQIFWLKNRMSKTWRNNPQPSYGNEEPMKPLHDLLEGMREGDK